MIGDIRNTLTKLALVVAGIFFIAITSIALAELSSRTSAKSFVMQKVDKLEKLITEESEKRKDTKERAKMINESDITFLCLPDAASIEAVSLVENDKVKIIDTSTAHRTLPEWAYGFAELSNEFRHKIETSNNVFQRAGRL